MKMNRFISITLSLALLLFPITIKAEDNTQEFLTGTSSGTVAVIANVEETYQIVLPTSISLIRNQETGIYEATYIVGVKADLLTGEKVTVIPDSTVKNFVCNGASRANASISQPINTWTPVPSAENEIASNNNQYIETQGTITASGITRAGQYSGTLNFTFTKIDRPGE